jgi:uncharacterized protein YcbK (DUF882 family)
VAVALVFWCDVLRRALGHALVVNSGFRCAGRNASVGGATSSRHLIGCAADIAKPARLEYQVFMQTARRLSCDGWEIVEYSSQTYIHVGVPRINEATLWNGQREITL